MTSTYSSTNRSGGAAGATPNRAFITALPTPRPRMNRPPAAWSSCAAVLAASTGGRSAAFATAVPTRTRRVAAGALELDRAKAGRLAADRPGCVVSRGDATLMADARSAVRAVARSFGGLDVLVNCVGIFDFYRGLSDLGDDQLDAAFDEIFAVNVKSQLVCVRAA